MTKRKTIKFKKKIQKIQKIQKKKLKDYPKYKIVTTTEYPLIRKTGYAKTIKSAMNIAKRNSIYIIRNVGHKISESHTQIYYFSPRLKKYKKMIHQSYTGFTYIKRLWGKEYHKVKRN